jgi:uncharacterized protein (TIGR03118 family)
MMSKRAIVHTLTVGAFLLGTTSCSNNDNEPGTESVFTRSDLVSDQAGVAAHADAELVNPWGIAFGPDTFFWVANNGTATTTLYDGQGVSHSDLVGGPVALPTSGPDSGPTGVVFNGGEGFVIESGSSSAPSRFIFATKGGTLVGWSPDVNSRTGVIALDESASGAAYTGLAIATSEDQSLLYAANFPRARIDVFDENFAPASGLAASAFIDPTLSARYAPFGVQAIGERIYVTYALQNEEGTDEVVGAGNGFVSVFELDGTFVARVASGGPLDAPWGVALAPEGFGRFGGALLVGNFGDGHITAFDSDNFTQLGQLGDSTGQPIAIEGLWGITFGNGRMAGNEDTLYFAAGVDDETHGLFGAIAPLTSQQQ